jgi:hypothetical protein
MIVNSRFMRQSAKQSNPISELANEAARLRERLAWKPNQLPEIHQLYSRYVELGLPFPLDLEEHSLWLILKFVRPDDDKVAGRLVNVLEMQGKPIPDDVKSLAVREFALPFERIADLQRERTTAETRNSSQSDAPLHERLFFVIGLPKSASRLMVSALAAMHPIERFKKQVRLPYTTGYTAFDGTADLRHDGFVGFTDGGIVHSHLNPTNVTRHALAHLGLGCVITIRHPADHLAAFYCHLRRISRQPMLVNKVRERLGVSPLPDAASSFGTYAREDEPNRLFFHGSIFPLDVRFFAPSVSVDDAIAHMIAGGYLYSALAWIVSWQLLRIRNTSTIVRYEDFVGNPEGTLMLVNRAMFPGNSDDAVAAGYSVVADKTYDTSVEPYIYPRGSTGAQGIWRNYFSTDNQHLYNSVCERFVAAHPYGHLLERMYANLFAD